jgi:hypothetical protein
VDERGLVRTQTTPPASSHAVLGTEGVAGVAGAVVFGEHALEIVWMDRGEPPVARSPSS